MQSWKMKKWESEKVKKWKDEKMKKDESRVNMNRSSKSANYKHENSFTIKEKKFSQEDIYLMLIYL